MFLFIAKQLLDFDTYAEDVIFSCSINYGSVARLKWMTEFLAMECVHECIWMYQVGLYLRHHKHVNMWQKPFICEDELFDDSSAHIEDRHIIGKTCVFSLKLIVFLPEASIGLRVLSLPASFRPSVRPSVTKFVRAITHHPSKLGSPNLDHRCKRPWLRSLLFLGVVDDDFQGQI